MGCRCSVFAFALTAQESFPQLTYHHLVIGEKALQSPLNTTHLGLTPALLLDVFADALQHATSRNDHPSYGQGQLLLLMSMQLGEQPLDLLLPFFPQYLSSMH
jgi:hypothetical protein